MAKYHIKKDGTPGECHATQGNCPLGGAQQHFDTPEQAQQFADVKSSEQFIDTPLNSHEMSWEEKHKIQDYADDIWARRVKPGHRHRHFKTDNELNRAVAYFTMNDRGVVHDRLSYHVDFHEHALLHEKYLKAGYNEYEVENKVIGSKVRIQNALSDEDVDKYTESYVSNLSESMHKDDPKVSRDEVFAKVVGQVSGGEYYANLAKNSNKFNYTIEIEPPKRK